MAGAGLTQFCKTCGNQLDWDSRFCSMCGMKVEKTSDTEFLNSPGDATGKVRLFHAYSIVNKFRYKDHYYDNVKINWFVRERQIPQIPFEDAIANYAELPISVRVHPENFIKECFTAEEAKALKHYLALNQKTNAFVEACHLPVTESAAGYRDKPPVPGVDFILIHKNKNCRLPFKVEGIFNVNMADRHITGDEQKTVITRKIT